MMFAWYIIANKKKLGQLRGNEFLVKTIVTTELIRKIADKNGVELQDCYTGFKWIAALIRENEGVKKYIGGGEESFGFLPFDKVRDKDSPASICLICEIAAWAKDNGKTLYDLLMDIYAEYGFSYNKTINVVRPGKTGADEIKAMMENFRSNPPRSLAGSPVCCTKDFKTLEATDGQGNKTPLQMPDTSNVLQWFTENGTKVSVRPSGTEPKIKFYLEIPETLASASDYDRACTAAEKTADAIAKELGL
jgi:phosphoglucomutase